MSGTLQRTVSLPAAVMLGLGSIVGTGVFVSIGIAAGLVGPGVVPALVLAAVVAGFNGLSSAQCAATWPVSGGTYEYGYRAIGPRAGFTAGWMFLAAKSASAATAALGLSGYLLHLAGLSDELRVPLAIAAVAATTALVAGGMQRSNRVNTVVVGFTLAVLGLLCAWSLPTVAAAPERLTPLVPAGPQGVPALLEASALMFVAYTGYGRIATLGEEVVDPARTIPKAIAATLTVVLVLYVAVGITAVGVLGAEDFARVTAETAAPLQEVARRVGGTPLFALVSVGAVTAMVGVLLNLVLGLSRVVLAMARRGDAPALLARVDAGGATPGPAVIATGIGVAALALLGDVKTTWSFSAFTVLVYYALTNLSAWRLTPEQRLYPRWTAAAGAAACLGLAAWIEPSMAAAGIGILLLGHLARAVLRGLARS